MITRLFLATTLLIAGIAHAQVTCQTYGNTTNCNGSLGSGSGIAAQPFVNYAAPQATYAQAALAQQQAELARAQADAIRQQTEALRQQQQIQAQRQQTITANQQRFLANVAAASDDGLRTQAEKWNSVDCRNSAACSADAAFTVPEINAEMQRRQQQQQSEAQAWNPESLQAEYESCANVQGAGAVQCRELKQRLDRALAAHPQTHAQVAAKGTAVPTDKLKADAATFEAIMRSAPPDSKAFRDAVKSLQATNEELARQGSLK
jgi:hypothetical protein